MAAAGSGGIGTGCPGGGFRRGLEGKQYRGMARGESPRIREDRKPGPAPRIVATAGKKGGERVAGRGQLKRRAPDRVRAHQRSGSLAERAGANLLAKLNHPALRIHGDIDHHPAAAYRRAPLDRGLRRRKPALMGNRGGKPEDVSIVEGRGHVRDIGAETTGSQSAPRLPSLQDG